jgi:tRNA(Ile)-lysidine synthase
MKLKNLIVTRKVNNKKLSTQNQKIKKFYNIFKSVVYRNIKKRSFLLAVSGGPDSLCLAYFGKKYSLEFKNKAHVVIVDHKLRKDSTKEAAKVKKMLKNKKIDSKIINWKGALPKSNIQKSARDIRYSLLSNYCQDNNIKYIVTGHHLDDQVENFFIRLVRGSGLTGLSSMAESADYNDKIKIIRPLLELEKKDLKYVTLNYFKNYVEDPSNKKNKFLRVRVRKYIKDMEKEGLNTSKIIKTVNNLLSANKAINFYKNKALYKHTSFLSEKKCMINKKIFSEEANEIIFKSFSDVLSLVSGSYYPPRSKKVLNLIERIKKNFYKKSTLGGCLVEEKDEFIIISKEQKNKKIPLELRK